MKKDVTSRKQTKGSDRVIGQMRNYLTDLSVKGETILLLPWWQTRESEVWTIIILGSHNIVNKYRTEDEKFTIFKYICRNNLALSLFTIMSSISKKLLRSIGYNFTKHFTKYLWESSLSATPPGRSALWGSVTS